MFIIMIIIIFICDSRQVSNKKWFSHQQFIESVA
jgi:hypothetical protein